MQRWNHSTHLVWRRYLFLRILDRKWPAWLGKGLVFACSSLWHGLKPTYYLILPETLIYSLGDTLILRKFPISREKDPLWKRLIRHVYVTIGMFSAASAWWFGTAESFWQIHKSHYFGPTVVYVVLYAIAWFIPTPKKVD
jgi:hypothetical protein